MTALSLFSGIGGLDLAAEAAGFAPVAFVEREPFCQSVLAHHWPEVPIHDDITAFPVRRYAGVTLVHGGFPCQDISAAGKGAGLAGERSGLWFAMLDVIAALRPRFVVAENVAALRSRGADVVLGGLEQAGYAAGAFVVAAEDMGAPHRRERVFIVAELADAESTRLAIRGSGCEDVGAERPPLERSRSYAVAGLPEPRLGRATDGVPAGMDRCAIAIPAWPARPGKAQHAWEAPRTTRGSSSARRARLKALGNAVVPAQVYPIFAALARRYREVPA